MTDSTRWHTVHPSAFAHEQQALDVLRANLPDVPPFHAWSNFEFIAEDGSINEVDALVVSLDCVYLIEIKHWAGHITGNQNSWSITSPTGRTRYEENPLLLANRKARKLKSLLVRQPAFRKTRVPFIQAAVFLSAAQCAVELDDVASQHVYLGPGAAHAPNGNVVELIRGDLTRGDRRPAIDRDSERAFARAMQQLGLRKRTRAETVGDYRLTHLLSENDHYQDWEAEHQRVPDDHKRIRIFPYAKSAAVAEKRERKDLATREYELLRNIHHDGILAPRQLTESDIGPALVYDFSPDAQRLDHVLDAADMPLGIEDRLDLIRHVAEALAHAHSRNVYHRALSPWSIELNGKQPVLRDWQSGIAGQGSTTGTRMTVLAARNAGLIGDPRAAMYVAPEVITGHGYDPVSMDIFSLGALAYALFSGQHPAATVEEMLVKCRRGPGLMVSEVLDGIPDSLQELIQFSTDPDPASRPADAHEFLSLLDKVEDDLTTPEPIHGVAPADAHPGDTLTGGFKVLRRLGAGSTCYALAVEDPDGKHGVLKVAKSPEHNTRLQAEAEALQALHHPNIVKCFGTFEIDGASAILIEQAGDFTLGRRLREQGPLSLDLLERFGDELLGALVHLEREGINHRDIKPENIGIGETRQRALTLKLFDFSLSRAPADNIRAGTSPYLEPFLGLRHPPRWDLQAERFAAAMTLHEMATGTLPTWGGAGQDPASTDDPVSLDIEKLDASVRDALAAFFRRALARDPRQRFDNADDMQVAWKNLFRHIDRTTLDYTDETEAEADLSRIEQLSADTPLSALGLSARDLNAADRIGAINIGQLLALPGIRFYRNRGIGQRTTRRLRHLRDGLRQRLGAAVVPDLPDLAPGVRSVDELAQALRNIKLDPAATNIIQHWLGVAESTPAGTRVLPSRIEVAEATGSTRAEVADTLATAVAKWARNPWMTELRDELVALLQRREAIVTLTEATAHLLTLHGSTQQGAKRQQLAAAVVQAALEVEAARESARFVLYRGSDVLLIVATPELGGGFHAPSNARAEYAKALARKAAKLAHQDPLPSPRGVEQALATVAVPAGDPPMSPERRLHLAAAAAPGVALSSRLELYPIGLSAERALTLGANTLLGARRLSVEQLHRRIQSRFPRAEPLPIRLELDRLLEKIDFPLTWHAAEDGLPAGYAMPARPTGYTHHTSTLRRLTTATHTLLTADPSAATAERFDATLHRALAQRRVLLLMADLARVEQAARELCRQYQLAPVSLDRLLVDALHAEAAKVHADWQVVLHADAADPAGADWRRLNALVRRVLPQVQQILLDDARPLLVQHLGLLVRYGQLGVIDALRDAARAGEHPARVLLLPGTSDQPPMLDGTVLPVITPADWAHVPRAWLENLHRAAPMRQAAGTPA